MTIRSTLARTCTTLALALLCAPSASAQSRIATLAIVNGHVVTVDSAKPEAEAVAIAGDRILAVGTTTEVRRLVGPRTRVIDANGRLVIPGFIEGHGHLLGLGDTKRQLDLTTARTWDEIVARVAAAARTAPRGAWIIGHGWHQEKWDRPPTPAVEGTRCTRRSAPRRRTIRWCCRTRADTRRS
jgi:predicted amidohydrolase YtcJ